MTDKNTKVGTVIHYYDHLQVGIVKLEKDLAVGDSIEIQGHTTTFKQQVSSMQFDHKPIEKAKKGDEIGIKVEGKVHEGNKVYLVKK